MVSWIINTFANTKSWFPIRGKLILTKLNIENDKTDDDNFIDPNKKPRFDTKGNQIFKGKKKHQIVFADKLEKSKPLLDVQLIESYKEYNKSKKLLVNGN